MFKKYAAVPHVGHPQKRPADGSRARSFSSAVRASQREVAAQQTGLSAMPTTRSVSAPLMPLLVSTIEK